MLSSQNVNGSKIFLLNNTIKIDPDRTIYIAKLRSNKAENYNFNTDDNLWYFQNYKKNVRLIDILYPDEKIIDVEFKNLDFDDYREINLILTKDNRFNNIFNPPDNVKIIETGSSIKITEGRYAGQYRNMYWKIKSKEDYICMHIKDKIYIKISVNDLAKLINLNGTRPIWYLHENGYVATTIRIGEESKFYYLHQYIMNTHDKNNSNFEKTVDHINRDKLDNRRENLRIATMSEQNENKDKQTRRKDACNLPLGIKSLPKYVEYRKEIYDKENNSQREFFIVKHPKQEKIWETTKSNKISIHDKLNFAKAKVDLIENKITEEKFKEVIGENEKLDLPIGISLKIVREKYHFILDLRKDEQRYNAKMILHSIDIQKELDKFIDEVVNIKYPNLMKKYKIMNTIDINKELISKEIKEDIINQKPTYPFNITVYEEKGNMYIQYNKKINDSKYSKKMKIQSNDIQKELDKLVNEINEKYPELKLSKQTVNNPEYFNKKESS